MTPLDHRAHKGRGQDTPSGEALGAVFWFPSELCGSKLVVISLVSYVFAKGIAVFGIDSHCENTVCPPKPLVGPLLSDGPRRKTLQLTIHI